MTKMTSRIFVDTNVLVYRSSAGSAFHRRSVETMDRLATTGAEFVASPQVVREYLRVMSRTGSALTTSDAQSLIACARQDFSNLVLLEETASVVERLYSICSEYPVMLRQVHDANIAATMLAHGVTHLLTNNVKHFEPLQALITLVPLEHGYAG
jgi:predicted nucleic acid-binding protein